MIEGAVDLVTVEMAVGWLSDKHSIKKFDVVAVVDGQIVGEGTANQERPDLKAAGFGDGKCGFEFGFYRKLTETDLLSVTIGPKGSTLTLPRATKDSYVDVLRSLTSRYPHAGRSRTVFGGLWTDRTDALQVLAGRVRAGSCDRLLAPDLRAYIADGIVSFSFETQGAPSAKTLEVFADPKASSARLKEATLELSPLLLNAHIADALRTILDDVPTAYRPIVVTASDTVFSQASAFETFSSPAEVAVCYRLAKGATARLDYVQDSHDLPEFGANGASRWTEASAAAGPVISAGAPRAVHSLELKDTTLTLVSPGLLHKLFIPENCAVFRIPVSPKRVTPTRFLIGDKTWLDLDLGNRVEARL